MPIDSKHTGLAAALKKQIEQDAERIEDLIREYDHQKKGNYIL
jgi:hypothetical protein